MGYQEHTVRTSATLLIYDAESSVSATAKAGYLGVFNTFQFGMYTPQPYVPFSGKIHTSQPKVSTAH